MNKTFLSVILALLGLMTAWAAGAYAMTSATYAVPAGGVTGGGGSRSSANYIMEDAIGQPVAGESASANYSLDGGVGYLVGEDGPPTSYVNAPYDGMFIGAASPTFTVEGSAIDDVGYVTLVEVSTDGGATWHVATGTATWSYEWTVPANGTYNILSRATDDTGFVETPSPGISVTVDKTYPAAYVSAPTQSESITGYTYQITGTATDGAGSGLAGVEVSVDNGATWDLATGKESWSYTWTGPANGQYLIRARATDMAYNVGAPCPVVIVTVDNVPAVVTLDAETYVGPAATATVTVDYPCGDTSPGPGNDIMYATVSSASEPSGEMLMLQEDGVNAGTFGGLFWFEAFSQSAENEKVGVSGGDTVTVTVNDPLSMTGYSSDNATWEPGRAMWVRSAGDIIQDIGTARDDLFAFCAAPHGDPAAKITTLYVDIRTGAYSGPPMFFPLTYASTMPAELGTFVSEATANGIRVEFLVGNPDSTPSNMNIHALSMVIDAIGYNNAAAPDEWIGGLHVGLVPDSMIDWPTSTAQIWSNYSTILDMVNNSITNNSNYPLDVAADMPADYDFDADPYTNGTLVQRLTDYVTLLSRADDFATISDLSMPGVFNAEASGKKAVIGVDTNDLGPADAVKTFFEEGVENMEEHLGIVGASFDTPAYLGMAVDGYGSYSVLPPYLPLRSNITYPAHMSNVSESPVTVTGTAFDDIGNGVASVTLVISNFSTIMELPATDTSGDGSWSTWSCDWTPAAEGAYRLDSRATDTLSNVEITGAGIFVDYNPNPPTLTRLSPLYGETFNCYTVVVAGTAFDTGQLSHVEVATDPSGPWTNAADTSGDGSWTSWSCVWVIHDGYDNVLYTRAVDTGGLTSNTDMLNVVKPSVGIDTFMAAPSGSCTAGTQASFTATGFGGSGDYEYQFEMRGPGTGGTLTVFQAWSSADTWQWDTDYADLGESFVYARIREKGSTGGATDTAYLRYVVIEAPLTLVSLVPDPADSSDYGDIVKITATATGGPGDYEYQYQRRGPDTSGGYMIMQTWTSANTYDWTPAASQTGYNWIACQVRRAGGSVSESYGWFMYVVTAPQISIDSFGANPLSPTVVGVPVDFQAVASGGSGYYEYQFQRRGPDTGGVNIIAQPWSQSDTYTYNPGAGSEGWYCVIVQVRKAGGSASEAYTWIWHEVKP